MDAIFNSEWIDQPICPGAYWMKDVKNEAYRICQVVSVEQKCYVLIPGYEAGIEVTDLINGELSFFGPLTLPTGTAYIYANAIYKDIPDPVEPIEKE